MIESNLKKSLLCLTIPEGYLSLKVGRVQGWVEYEDSTSLYTGSRERERTGSGGSYQLSSPTHSVDFLLRSLPFLKHPLGNECSKT